MKLHPFWDDFPSMRGPLMKVAGFIQTVLDESPGFLKKDLDPLFSSPGKMLRPAFTLLAATSGDDESPYLYQTAAAIELLHTATLVHDDVIDKAVERRGVPTINSQAGVKRAVLAGDFLLLMALELASAAHEKRLIDAMNSAARKICLGEIEQDGKKGGFLITREAYFDRINGKTAELFALAAKAGALLGGSSDKAAEAMYRVGQNFGLAFQIEDDILDYSGKAGDMGKASGKDLKEGIPTLPLILAAEDETSGIARLCRSPLRPLYNRTIRRRIVSGGFTDAAGKIGEAYRNESLSLLSESKAEGGDLFAGIITRLKSRDR